VDAGSPIRGNRRSAPDIHDMDPVPGPIADPESDSPEEQDALESAHARLRAKSLALMFAVGTLLLLLSLFTLNPEDPSRTTTAAAGGAVMTALLFAGGRRIPGWALQLFLACGTVLIEWVIYGTGENASTYTVFYFWIAIYAFQFFTTLQAMGQIAFVFLSYGIILGLFDDPTSPGGLRWALTTTALVVAGAMIGVLKDSNAKLVAEVTEAARSDSLTRLLNRRGFDERFGVELARARRQGERLSLLIGDLDRFKELNDAWGHQEGDEVLRVVGDTIALTARESDAAARIGGEEFAILLPDTDEQGAYLAAERLRASVQEACAGLPNALTISVGVATFPQHGREGDSLMRAADAAVYMAKQLGRDRTVLFDPETASALAAIHRKKRPDHERQLATALRLAEALDIRDAGTAAHSQTVARYAEGTARALGFSPDRCERVRWAGIVHDVGKIGVDDAILLKPGALTVEEEAEMRKHPEIGARILAGSDLSDISSWVVAHHERPDGDGYPLGLSRDQIPLEAQILAVADAYEAMTNERPYRPAMSPVAAQNELIRGVGRQFESSVVHAFLSVVAPDEWSQGPVRGESASLESASLQSGSAC
jgi:diguanylate cyclase (GGDEF)-like protein/putative nucleotidyltransferase with HDIG domain